MSASTNEPHRITGQSVLEAAEWFAARRQGLLEPAEAEAFIAWLQSSPRHVAEYLEIAAIAAYLPSAAQQDSAAVDELVAQADLPHNVVELATDTRFSTPSPRRASKRARPSRAKHAWTAGMAALLLIAAIGAVLRWTERVDERSYITAPGEYGEWKLPDRTTLRLNAASAVRIRFDRERRQIDLLHGQAMFDVAEHEVPFEVRSGRHLIEDIGTRFDVLRDGAETTVTVVEGRVHVWDVARRTSEEREGEKRSLVDLVAGDRALMAGNGSVKARSRIDEHHATAWTRGEIAFESESLASVVAEFNRYGNRRIRIGDSDVGDLLVSGTFGIHDAETFIAFLESLPDVRIETSDDGVLVRTTAANAR
jgi:transmembrane sensor